jgi:hypothetical protein
MLLRNEKTGEIITKPMGTTIEDAIDSYYASRLGRTAGGEKVSASVPVSDGPLDPDRRDGGGPECTKTPSIIGTVNLSALILS